MYTIRKDVLVRALAAVSAASTSKVPIYTNTWMQVTPQAMSLACFNGAYGIEAHLAVTPDELSEKEFSVGVDACTLKEITGTLEAELKIGLTDEGKLAVQAAGAKASLKTTGDSLPAIDDPEALPLFTLSGKALRSLLAAGAFSSSEAARPALQVVMLDVKEKALVANAADGFSAAAVAVLVEGLPAESVGKSLALPAGDTKFTTEMARILRDDDQVTVKISPDGNHYLFCVVGKDLTLIVNTSAGTREGFPHESLKGFYAEVLAGKNSAAMKAAGLLALLKQVKAVGAGMVNILIKDGAVLAASVETKDTTGQTRCILPASHVQGEGQAVISV